LQSGVKSRDVYDDVTNLQTNKL